MSGEKPAADEDASKVSAEYSDEHVLCQVHECCGNVAFGSDLEDVRHETKYTRAAESRSYRFPWRDCLVVLAPDRQAELAGCCLGLAHFHYGGGIADIAHDRQPAQIGDNLPQQFEALGASVERLECQTRVVRCARFGSLGQPTGPAAAVRSVS